MALPQFTMSELLAAGVHFGHRSFRWNPRLKSYIYGVRNGIHILDLQQTVPLLYTALAAIESTVARGGRVLFVGTKKQAQGVVVEAAERSGMYYVNHRWLGGLMTNWQTVNKSIRRLRELDENFAASAAAKVKLAELQAAATAADDKGVPVPANAVTDPMAHLTKKEQLMQSRERDNLKRVLGGIVNMAGLPDLIVVLGVHQDRIAVDEANRLNIPVVGVVDTNSSDEGVNYVIPGNDDSVRALGLYGRLCADAILSGIALQAQQQTTTAAGTAGTRSPRSASVSLSAKAQAAANAPEVSSEKPAA